MTCERLKYVIHDTSSIRGRIATGHAEVIRVSYYDSHPWMVEI